MATTDFAIYSDSPSPPRKSRKSPSVADTALRNGKTTAGYKQKPVLQIAKPNESQSSPAVKCRTLRRSLSLSSPSKTVNYVQTKDVSFTHSINDSGFSETPLKGSQSPSKIVLACSPVHAPTPDGEKPQFCQPSINEQSFESMEKNEIPHFVKSDRSVSLSDLKEAAEELVTDAAVTQFEFALKLQNLYALKVENKKLCNRYIELQNMKSEFSYYIAELEDEIEIEEKSRDSAVSQSK